MEAWELLSKQGLVDLPCGCRHKVEGGKGSGSITDAVQDLHAITGMSYEDIVTTFTNMEFARHTCPARPVLPPEYQACIKCGDQTPDGVYCKSCPQPSAPSAG